VSCATSSTTAGGRAGDRAEGERAFAGARGGKGPVALHPREVHAPAEVEEHEAEGDVHEDARLLQERADVHGRGHGRDQESDKDITDDAGQPQLAGRLAPQHAGHEKHAEEQRVVELERQRRQEARFHGLSSLRWDRMLAAARGSAAAGLAL
jgi:hypothetical protein